MDITTDFGTSNDTQEGPYIGEEERIRHDALFYSQSPEDGLLLSGDRARSLFIKSKLPLQDLSKIWKLADVTRDNMLDESEFAVAVHLIQRRLCGFDIPLSIPTSSRPEPRPLLVMKQIREDELRSYEAIFHWLIPYDNCRQNNELVLKFLGSSGIPFDVLANIWDLSDIDRDGKINKEEFFIALHLTRFCVDSGSHLEGSVDVVAMLPKKTSGESIQDKRRRRTEYQTEMRKLRSLKEKLESELTNAESNKNSAAKSKIQHELDRTKIELEGIIKKEIDVGKEITELNLQTSVTTNIEVLRPFDRSFLMKRQSCGKDFLEGIQYKPGHCLFCEGVTREVFVKDNILNFALNLPVNPNSTAQRRSPTKDFITPQNQLPENYIANEDIPKSNHRFKEVEKTCCVTDSHSSDDESDSVDIGFKRRRRNKTRPSREKRETISQRRIRSLSEAIGDIEARNKAARKEMDKKMIRIKSDLGSTSGETSSYSSNEKDKISRKREAYKRRSKSAIETFQQLLSSDSGTSSDRGSDTGRRSLKGLQRAPRNEQRETASSSLSESEIKQLKTDGKIKSERKGPRNPGQEYTIKKNTNNVLMTDDRELVISVVKNEKNEFDFETQLSPVDKLGKSPLSSYDVKDQVRVKNRAKSSIETKTVNGSLQDSPNNHREEVTIVNSLKLNPIVANGFGQYEEDTVLDAEISKSQVIANGLESRREIEEEAVAPRYLPLDERVQSLMDLLEETSCDSIEEENYRRKLSKSEDAECSIVTSDAMQVKSISGASKAPQFSSSTTANEKSGNSSVNSRFRTGSSNDIARPHSDSDAVPNKAKNGEADSGVTVKRRKVLKTRGGHIVRSKSVHGVHGLRNLLDPDKLSFVEECEWLDNLVQVELETIERRKLEEATQSPKVERERPTQLFTRDETIDENSLNLGDSRKLVKSLLDMEVELREEKELYTKRKEKLGERDRHVLERSKSMPVSQGVRLESECTVLNEKGLSVKPNITTEAETNADEAVAENQIHDSKHFSAPLDAKSSVYNSKNKPGNNSDVHKMKGGSVDEAQLRPWHKTSSNEYGKEDASDLSHVPPVPKPTAHADNTEEQKMKNVPNKDYKAETPGNLAVQELSHQPEVEDRKQLKHIRAFKELFEGKSAPIRPIDDYQKSLSMEVRPLGLLRSRSKSLGDGLNRPSDESFHIQVFEKQSSFDNGMKRRESTGNKDKDVVYYEEAMMDMRRRKSGQDAKRKQESVAVDEMAPPEVVEDDAKTPTSEGDPTPIFKKVGDFKQLFEGEKAKKEATSKKKVAIVKRGELKQGSHNGGSNDPTELRGVIDNEKSSIKCEKNGKVQTGGDVAKHIQPKERSIDEISSTKDSGVKSADDSMEDGIPSIKDRLLLFQSTNVGKDEVKLRHKEIRKIRPKSFHGDGRLLRSTDIEDSPAEEPGLESLRFEGHIRSPEKQFIKDLGECMINNEGHTSERLTKVSPTKQIVMDSTETEDDVSRGGLLSKNFQDNAERDPVKPTQRNPREDFSYMRIVKDDRIRREIQEQEAREAEMKMQLAASLSSAAGPSGAVKGEETMEDPTVQLDDQESKLVNSPSKSVTPNDAENVKVTAEIKGDSLQKKNRFAGKNVKADKFSEGVLEDGARNVQNMKIIDKEVDLRGIGMTKDNNGNVLSKDVAPHAVTQRGERGSIKLRKVASKIEMELEEERRREKELEEERKQREEEQNRILEEQKRQMEAIEAEKKKAQDEELAKQIAVREEKMKRQERTRGLRALFEAS